MAFLDNVQFLIKLYFKFIDENWLIILMKLERVL